MVHVSDAGGRHKMLAFSTEPNINTIVSVKEDGNNAIANNSREIKSNNSFNLTNLSIIVEESSAGTMNNILEESNNGNDSDNGNVSFTSLSQAQPQLDLFDSESETQALLINGSEVLDEKSNISNSSNNKVFTEEIIVVSNGKKKSPGKVLSGFSSSSSSSHVSKSDWQSSSQSNESEESPLLTGETASLDTNMSTPTNPNVNISNDTVSPVNASTSVITSTNSTHSKHGKFTNGTKHTGLKRVSFGSSKGSMVETLIFESPVSEEPEMSKTGNGVNLSNGTIKSACSSNDPNDSLDSNASG
ncbi:unnamed protein product [Allacma fusca]|uniref:Uncharacterized protein n=1 Tax=Allacma fusca TaxID=39272 RepID=A0A8J2PZQ0_9HEXA|nr:unnamed protein product [Allacma fusca]